MENHTATLGQVATALAETLPETGKNFAPKARKPRKSQRATERQGLPRSPKAVRAFAKTPTSAIEDTRLSATDFRVLSLLIARIGGKDYWAVPIGEVVTKAGETKQGITEALGISQSTVKRSLKTLTQLGYIVTQRTTGWNRYSLTPLSDPNCQLISEKKNPEISPEGSSVTLSEGSSVTLTLLRENELDETNLVGECASPEVTGAPSQLVEAVAVSVPYLESFLSDFPSFTEYLEAVEARLSRHCETRLDLSNGSKAVEKSLKALKKAYDWKTDPKEIEAKAVNYFATSQLVIRKTKAHFLATNLAVILDHTPIADKLPSPSFCPNCGKPQDLQLGLCGDCIQSNTEQLPETLLEAPETPSEGFQPVSPETLQGILSTHYKQGVQARKINL